MVAKAETQFNAATRTARNYLQRVRQPGRRTQAQAQAPGGAIASITSGGRYFSFHCSSELGCKKHSCDRSSSPNEAESRFKKWMVALVGPQGSRPGLKLKGPS
jgi:hypothetical protein